MSIRYYRNDETGNVFAASRCKTMNESMMLPKMKAATMWNRLIKTRGIKLTRTGRVKQEEDLNFLINKLKTVN